MIQKSFAQFVALPTILLLALSCGGRSRARNTYSDISLTDRGDSLVVDGVFTEDSIKLVILREILCEQWEPVEFINDLWRIPGNLPWVRLKIGHDICGYDVEAILYPDELNSECGYARYILTKGGNSMTVDASFCWPWYENVGLTPEDKVKYSHTYEVTKPFTNLVQEDYANIEDCIICFKDVDFDAQKELCISAPGYNRKYYNAYKIIEGKIWPLASSPYHNIVYSYETGQSTEFDYGARTISVSEPLGAAGNRSDVYVRKDIVDDPLFPMRHLSGIIEEYQRDLQVTKILEAGRIVRIECTQYIENHPGCIVATYRNTVEDMFELVRVVFKPSGKNEEVLFESITEEIFNQ